MQEPLPVSSGEGLSINGDPGAWALCRPTCDWPFESSSVQAREEAAAAVAVADGAVIRAVGVAPLAFWHQRLASPSGLPRPRLVSSVLPAENPPLIHALFSAALSFSVLPSEPYSSGLLCLPIR